MVAREKYYIGSLIGLVIVIIVLVLRLLGLFSTPPAPNNNAVILPPDAKACMPEGAMYDCTTQAGTRLTITIPEHEGKTVDVTPYVLPASPDQDAEAAKLPKDGFNCLGPTIVNVAFYDNEKKHLVTRFWDDVTLDLTLPPGYLEKLSHCSDAADLDPRNIFLPVFLYTPISGSNVQIWKPFQNYTLNSENGTLSVTFKTWGDPRLSVGYDLQAGFGPKP